MMQVLLVDGIGGGGRRQFTKYTDWDAELFLNRVCQELRHKACLFVRRPLNSNKPGVRWLLWACVEHSRQVSEFLA